MKRDAAIAHRRPSLARAIGFGVLCPECSSGESRVTNTRPYHGYTWRQRACSRCDHKWHTYETNIPPALMRNMTKVSLLLDQLRDAIEEIESDA